MASLIDVEGGQTGLRIDFNPSPKSEAFIADTHYITGHFGPFGCGKTSNGVLKTYLYGQAFPGAKLAAIRDTWPNLRDTTRATFFEWFPPGLAGHYHKTDKMYEVYGPDGPFFVYFRAMDSDRDIKDVLSLELAAAWLDEPQGGINAAGGLDPGINVSLYRSLLGRIGRQKGYRLPLLWMTGNPPDLTHWIAQEFGYHGEAEPSNPYTDRQLFLGRPEDNIANLEEGWGYYERLMRNYGRDTPLAKRFALGLWVSMGMEKPFRKEWFRYWGRDGEPELPPVTYVDAEGRVRMSLIVEAGIDLAISLKDTAARSAYTIAAQSRHPDTRGRIFVLESTAGHWSVWQQARHVLQACRRHRVRSLRIEDVAYQAAFKDIMDREARATKLTLGLELIKPDGDKIRRANAWSPLVEDSTVLFPPSWVPQLTEHGEEWPEDADLLKCMLAIPGDPTKWDPPDSAGICIRGFPAIEMPQSRLPGTAQSTPALAESYAGLTAPQTAQPRHPAPFRRRLSTDLERAKGYAARRPGAPEPRKRGR